MMNLIAQLNGHPELAGFSANCEAGIVSPAHANLAAALLGVGQHHLYAGWDAPAVRDPEKQEFLATLLTAHRAYPGGLPAYIRNARILLAEASAGGNPFDGCTPAQPDLVDLSGFGAAYDAAEAAGLKCFAESAVVLVAGGLGERLGYHGIKLDIPVEVAEKTSYLAHFAAVIGAASQRLGRKIPLIIMTSRETDEGTRSTLADHHHFGLDASQVTILCQELVPALSDIAGHLAMDGKYHLVLKPHGHGDIHMLLQTSGTAKRLAASGVRYLLFVQDTNGQAFNAALAAIGVSELHGYDFNSIAVNRIPGEAVGGIAKLEKPGAASLTLNVEYNQLDPLLRATVSPEGDVPDSRGFSLFPGNINLLVIRLAPYLRVLESSGGIIAEFVNPKFSDPARTQFKKPARLETMMQDLPKLFVSGENVGVTVFDRTWCFSACKNALADAADKVRAGGPPESASSAENDFYLAGRAKLRAAGMGVSDAAGLHIQGIPVTVGPRVILRPSFALTLADVRERIRGGSISGASTLILDGDIRLENVTVPEGAALVISARPGASLQVKDLVVPSGRSFELQVLTSSEMSSAEVPEYLRIRGYRIADCGARRYVADIPGKWVLAANGAIEPA
ncbi:MAG: UTP--glucose-1-phosphate uridylyltransferase [Verrucomicrobiae bacterium]